MTKFHQELLISLKKHFGFKSFRPGQEKVLTALLHHQNVLGILPTGSGKTLIYQLYGFLISQPIVIISPLLSLMQDQVSRMQSLGIKNSVAINSLLNHQQRHYVLAHLNRYQYIFISPEMLANLQVQKIFCNLHLGLVVIDEVHCISQWGPDFRPEYLNLRNVLINLDHPQVLLLTATASVSLRHDILHKLGFNVHQIKEIIYPVNRPNIFLDVKYVQNLHDKNLTLIKLIKHLKMPGIVYFSSKKRANQIAQLLSNKCFVHAEPYHSGLDQNSRYRIQHQFMNNQINVICATSAFGMGINKDNIRFVIHYHLPANLGTYMQEIGRAGRDGKQSIGILLYQAGDEELPYTLSIDSIPTATEIRDFFYHPRKYHSDKNNLISVLNYYRLHHFTVKETIKIFTKHRQQRKIQLLAMVHFVQTQHCKRAFLLKHFDEVAPPHNQMCCNYKIPANLKRLGLYVNHQEKAISTTDLNWYPLLNHLFKI